MPIEHDGWLAERFGHPVWTVRGAASAEVRDHAAGHGGPALYQAKVPAREIDTVLDLATAGLGVVNVSVVLARAPGELEGVAADGVEVRELDPARDEGVLDVAAGAFSRSRFHLDPRIPGEVADSIKREWVRSYLRGTRGETAYVAIEDGALVGVLAVLVDGDARVIDLVGVAGAARSRGVGAALLGRFLGDSEGRCERVEVGTQAANEEATRFYERAGFRTARSVYDLHRVDAG